MTKHHSTRLTGPDALKEIEAGALLIDVRSEAGRHQNGEVYGAVVVPKPDVVTFVTQRTARKSDQQKIIVFCGSVAGSQPAVEKLTEAGVVNVFDVEGGYAALTQEGGLRKIEPPKPEA